MSDMLTLAKQLDANDPLASYRQSFHFPEVQAEQQAVYLVGNSLGLQPKQTRSYVNEFLDDWARYGVVGHLEGAHPWLPYHRFVCEALAELAGAKPSEVVAMNTLTANLHFMMVSFFRPQGKRCKILMEANAFPSDRYAVLSQLRFHGLTEDDLIIVGETDRLASIERQAFLDTLSERGDEIALVLLGGLQYLTGQWLPIADIAEAAHAKGCVVGCDLAHAMGNLPLQLHDWSIDFAVWCSYKYLNAGAGSTAGAFVHERHLNAMELPRFEGWWGNEQASRFEMKPTFQPAQSVEAWQLSNPAILPLAALRASLDLFQEVGMESLRNKSKSLTQYLAGRLQSELADVVTIITPMDPEQRGAQLSLSLPQGDCECLEKQLLAEGVFCDYREPGILRVAPTPFYNSYLDCHRFVEILKRVLS